MLKWPPPSGGRSRYLAGVAMASASCMALYALLSLPVKGQSAMHAAPSTIGLSYWIELVRNGKTYRCDDTFTFRSHDAIRFHVFANQNGYAYLVLRTGSKGGRALLFPSKDAGYKNRVRTGRESLVPSSGFVMFDNNAGIENVALVYSKAPLSSGGLVAGSRPPCSDIPKETILPRDLLLGGGSNYSDKELSFLLAKSSASLTVLRCQKPSDVLYADINLAHE